jgi:uncharacterized membrane protein YuzA (DUF378 family)
MAVRNPVDLIALILVIVGGLNWGLVGLFGFDLVAAIFGDMSTLTRIVYILVGLAALYMIYYIARSGERSPVDLIALILVIVGGLNWGLIGLFGFDLVAAIFGDMSTLSRLIYILVGLAAVYAIYYAVRSGERHPVTSAEKHV